MPASALWANRTPPPRGLGARKTSNETSGRLWAKRTKKGGPCKVNAGKTKRHKRKTYFSPSDTLRAGFLAARGVLSRWYSSLPVRDSASWLASRVFFAAISASMLASVALN